MPVVAVLLIALGTFVTFRFLTPRRLTFGPRPGARFLAPLGLFAGALDSVGGGGWGPVGTSSLLASGRLEPRKVVGSVDTAEFVVAVGGSLGFLVGLGAHGIEWAYVLALMVGGVVAAPIAAVLVRYLPARVLGVAAGGLIVLTNLQTLADRANATAVTEGLLASLVFTMWVLWTAWAVKIDQPAEPADPRSRHARRRVRSLTARSAVRPRPGNGRCRHRRRRRRGRARRAARRRRAAGEAVRAVLAVEHRPVAPARRQVEVAVAADPASRSRPSPPVITTLQP